MSNRIDIGNVRGIKGDKGEKGDIGRTPSYEDLKYQKKDDEFVALLGTGNITQYYVDVNGKLCNKDGYLLDENKNPTTNKGQPFDISEYGYDYKPVWMDEEGHFTNNKGELLDENDEVIYVKSDFISDITAYIYEDEEAYDQLVGDIYPNIVNTLTDTSNIDKYRAFFDEIEGDIKYYICEDNPKTSIYIKNDNLVNTCKYYDENGELAVDNTGNYASVPLEKNALYLYNVRHIDDNEIMHYDVYLCTKANTVPKKIISSADFSIDYNVIDDLKVDVEQGAIDEEKDVYLRLFTRGTRGQFYSMNDVDILFDNNVISKLGANNGIAQLNGNGKVPSSQLPAYIDDIVEGTMNSAVTVFTPTDETYIDSVKQKGKIYVDTNSRKTYRWSGSNYVLISNPIVVDDGSTEAFSSTKGTSLETKIGNTTLNTTSKTVTGAINEHESDITSLNNNKEDKSNKTTVWHNESNTLRDTHYPSEKLVKDSLDTKLDITTFNTEKQSLINNFTVTVDDEWDSTSTNPVQAKIINEKFFDKDDIINLLNSIEIGENGGKLLTVYIDEETGDLVVENDGFDYCTMDEVGEKFTYTSDESTLTLSNNQFSIKNGGVTNEKIANNTINGHEKIVADSITTSEIANNAIHTDELADKNITQAKFTDSLSNYIDGKIDKKASQILANDDLNDYKTVGFYYSYDNNRTSTLNNVPENFIGGFSLFVYGSRMNNSVENYVHQLLSSYDKDKPHLLFRSYSPTKQEWGEWIELFTRDSAIINTHNLTDGAISTEKILNYAVTNEKISSNAISNGKLANDSVTNSKIKDGNVSYRKLESHLQDTIDGKINSLATKINIGDDLNEYVRNGFYSCNSGSVAKTVANYPNINPNGFGLLVMNNSSEGLGNVNQLLATYNNSNQNYFIRSYDSYHQSWSNWNKIITNSKYILQEKFNCNGGQTECEIAVYSDDQNVLITFKGQTAPIQSSHDELIESNQLLSEKYRPFIRQKTSDLVFKDDYSSAGELVGIIEENGKIKLYTMDGIWETVDISGSIMYPLKSRVNNNILLETNEGIGLNKSTDFIATLSGSDENTLVEFYEEYNLGLEVDSDKYIVHDDSTTVTAKLVDSNDKSRIKQEDVLVEFYEEYSISDINLNDIKTIKTEDTVVITAIVFDEDGSRIENETVEFFIENDTETEN